MKRDMRRKGFTLVELLIVIVVIGILSAMMMLSSTEAVTAAKASNIVSNFRNLKTAALALYTDSMDHFADGTLPTIEQILKKMGMGSDASTDCAVVNTGDTGGWYLSCTIKGTASEITQIQNKLKGRAKSSGLLKTATAGDGTDEPYDGTKADVYYFVR